MKRLPLLLLAGLLIFLPLGGCAKGEQKTITAFVGSASKPAMEEAAQAFEPIVPQDQEHAGNAGRIHGEDEQRVGHTDLAKDGDDLVSE